MNVFSQPNESKDITQKNLEGYPDVAADILNVFIYGGAPTVQAGHLYPAPTETEYAAPGSALRNQLEDISKYEIQDGKIRVQYLLANQSDTDSKMVLRKAGYVGAIYREQYDGKMQDDFPVVSLLLYWGKERWSRPRSIRDFFRKKGLSPQIRNMLDDIKLHVFDMRNLQPEVREQFQSDMRHVVDYLAEGDSFRSDRPVIHKEALIRLLRALGGDVNVEDTALVLEKMNVKEEDEITMCELFDQYTRRGRQEGRIAGIEEGRKEGLSEGIQRGRIEGIREGIIEGIQKGRVEGIKEGLSEGLQKGLQALISTCHELGVSFDETAFKVKEKFSLGENEVRNNMLLYW